MKHKTKPVDRSVCTFGTALRDGWGRQGIASCDSAHLPPNPSLSTQQASWKALVRQEGPLN
jgi:hypothetical protein